MKLYAKNRLACTLAVSLVACASPPAKDPSPAVLENAPALHSSAANIPLGGRLRSLTFDEALVLVLANDDAFAPFALMGANRRKPAREVAYLGLELLDGRGSVLSRASMTFRPLPHNLEYVSHMVLASASASRLHEAFISMHGITQIVNWSSRDDDAGPLPSSKPDHVAIFEGALFPPTDHFAFSQHFAPGAVIRMECKLVDVGAARTLNANLAGEVKSFDCRGDMDEVFTKYWYLEDAQRYVASEIYGGGDLLSRFRITDVAYRQ